jgi:hypothetical protein
MPAGYLKIKAKEMQGVKTPAQKEAATATAAKIWNSLVSQGKVKGDYVGKGRK